MLELLRLWDPALEKTSSVEEQVPPYKESQMARLLLQLDAVTDLSVRSSD